MGTIETKYKFGNSSAYYISLRQRVDDYFQVKKITRYANSMMVTKMVLTIILYFGSYGLILSNRFSIPVMILLAIVMGISLAGIFLNISHDASHFAIAKDRKTNRILCYSMELIGLNSYIWHYLHNVVHHIYPSIEGEDIIIEEYSILRLSKNQPYQKMHKYQIYYAPLIYSLFSILLIFVTDFALFARKRMGKINNLNHPPVEYFKLYFFKAFFLLYSLVIPLIVLDLKWWQVLLGYYIMQASAGIILSMVGVLNHQINESSFPLPDQEGFIHNYKKDHELEVTIDFSPRSKLASWIFGGFNTHVAHHLFPNICHIHYVPLTKIIKETSKEFGVEYKERTLWSAILSHMQYLKRLSKG